MKHGKRSIWAWAFYDWANSAFATTVMAGFFPIFFKQYWSLGTDVNTSTAQLGLGNSLASLAVAIAAPVLGAISDRAGLRKRFLILFAYLGILMTTALFVVGKGQWQLAILIYLLGIVGFSGANIFYDSLLLVIAPRNKLDWVSGLGFSMGYLGGGLLFFLNVLMTLTPQSFGLSSPAEAVKVSFLTVAAWWTVFSLPLFFWVKDERVEQEGLSFLGYVKFGFKKFFSTLKKIRKLKSVFLFLLAYWFYIDGVDTIIRMAVDYGISLGFSTNSLIKALLMVQFIGFPAALAFGKLGEVWSVKKAIYLGLLVYVGITLWGMLMREEWEFYVLALMVGLVQGGVQALSRSFYSRLIPKRESAEFFGFYNMVGKFAAIIGPALMGLVAISVRKVLMPPTPNSSQIQQVSEIATRISIGSVLLLFLLGGVLLSFVKGEKGGKTT